MSVEAEVERALRDVAVLVEELGPRPAGSEAEARAVAFVRRRLVEEGWEPGALGCADCTVACRGAPRRLFLAHVDSVAGSPGAVDNAAGVAGLLALAGQEGLVDLCLGFPPGEEAGLRGSRLMARAWPAPLPELVVALDLVGQGRLSVTGLGPRWGSEDLRWLFAHSEVDSPYLYRAVSRAFPGMERSDHAPFAARGARALHLLGRGEGGVFARYHQPGDRLVEPAAMAALLRTLSALARAPLPTGAPDGAGTLARLVLPAFVPPLLLLALAAFALRDLLRPCEGRPVLGALAGLLRLLLRSLPAALALAGPLALCTLLGLFPSVEAEWTAAAVMGIPASGWWAGAPVGVGLGLLLWLLVRRRWGGVGSPTLAAALLALPAALLDPLLAAPLALAGLLGRLHPLLAALPALYLLWPDHLRELAFHGLLPPALWGLGAFLLLPASGTRRRTSSPSPA